MAYTITSESYGPRKPFITATATSTDDLTALGTDFAEGSTCVISTTTYKLDKVKGWIDPSQGGGSSLPEVSATDNGDVLTVVEGEWNKAAPSGGGALVVNVSVTDNGDRTYTFTCDKTAGEIYAACPNVLFVVEDPQGLPTVSLITAYDFHEVEGYTFIVFLTGMETNFLVASAEDYPTYLLDDGGQ